LFKKLKGEKILNTEKEILTHWPHSSVSIFPKIQTGRRLKRT